MVLLDSLATTAALILDFYVFRANTRRGVYKLHDLDSKGRPQVPRGAQFTEEEPRESTAWEAPRPSMGPYSSEREGEQSHAYATPENQFDYDTGYHGHGPEGHVPERQKLYGDA